MTFAKLIPAALAVLFVCCCPAAALADETDTVTADCTRALILGPLPAGPEVPGGGVLRGKQVVVPEITPERQLPTESRDGWRARQAGNDGRFSVDKPGVYWIAARLRSTLAGDVTLKLDHGSALYSEGKELSAEAPGETAESLTGTTDPAGGWIAVYGRVVVDDLDKGFSLQAEAASGATPSWTLDRALPWTRFADTDQVPRISGLAVADGGRFVARNLRRRSDGTNRLDVLDGDGFIVAADAGGAGVRALGFLPGSSDLLLRRGGDLLLWDVASGKIRTLLEDERGLAWVKVGPKGRLLLFASSGGFEAGDPADGPGRRYRYLRERVTDFDPTPHLHMLDLETGVRRVLTRPGDFALDDAVFSSRGRAVFYGRTVPIADRPWFRTEIRRLDLKKGTDELLAEFTSGWEVRPQFFAASPNGNNLMFLGPPEEIGDYGTDAVQHNVYNKQVWTLDLAKGRIERLTEGESYAFEGGGGTPRFLAADRLLLRVIDGSRNRLAILQKSGGRWSAEALPQSGETLHSVATSPDGGTVAYTASSPARPATLHLAPVGTGGKLLEDPAADLQHSALWSPAQDMSFPGPGGETIDAWFHPPLVTENKGGVKFGKPKGGSAPLIVYYYGGAASTMRSFSTTFQFFAANGYGVLAVNSRGAAGWGQEFADWHAGDWGPAAAADIMAATDHVLQQNPWLDADAIGIYGGSYGGFMTNYLVSHTDRYAAAVSMYGISDLATYWGQGAWGVTYGDMALGGRNPWADPDFFISNSPLFQADQVKTPLLLLHGQSDVNVTPGESTQLFSALTVLDQPVEMVLFPGEGHGISGSWENRVAHRTMMLEWFDRWLKDRPEAWDRRWE